MLYYRSISKPSDVNPYFQQYIASEETWVVSDLRSKLELQSETIEKQGYALENSILRVSDLWKQCLKKIAPEMRLVSSEIVKLKLKKFFQDNQQLEFDENLISSLLIVMDQLSSICINYKNENDIEEWFHENPTSALRWKSWYLYARVCLRYILSEKLILPSWVPSFLLTLEFKQDLFSKHLYFDLAGEISFSEVELIQKIASYTKVTVLAPVGMDSKYETLLSPYKAIFADENQFSSSEQLLPISKFAITGVRRFSTQLAEVKAVVSEVYKLLNDNVVKPHEIAIVAPDIEVYWPSLNIFLKEEGISSQKNNMMRLQSLPQFQVWLSRLRILKEQWQKPDLESVYYSIFTDPKIDYSRFKSLYSNIYESVDLERNPDFFEKLFIDKSAIKNSLSRDEFIFNILLYWEINNEFETLINFLKVFIESTPSDLIFHFSDWMVYFESIISKKELLISTGNSNSVHVTSLMSADIRGLKKRYIIGLDEESLKTVRKSPLYNPDLLKLSEDTKLFVDPLELNFKDFELDWILKDENIENFLSFSMTDFQGNILSPSATILKAEAKHEIFLPDFTRMDLIQSSLLENSFRKINNTSQFQQNLNRDTFSRDDEFEKLKNTKISLSASTLEKYLDCPFVVAAEKVFKLKDEPEVDLQVDAMTRGQLIHELFHRILTNSKTTHLEAMDIETILDDVYLELKPKVTSFGYWKQYRQKLSKICSRFIQFEIDWRKLYPETQTVGTEVPFLIYFNPVSGELSKNPLENSLKISGKVDRIDSNLQNQFVVIDYKSSSAGLTSHPQWFKNNQIQLLMYLWCLEKELILDFKGEVIGTFYYVFKDFQRDKGLQIEVEAGSLFPSAGRKHSKIQRDEKLSLVAQFEKLLTEISLRISEGDFPPKPKDPKECINCEWRQLCRASHLA